MLIFGPSSFLLSNRCLVTVNVLCLFRTVPWVGLQFVIVVFPDNTKHQHVRIYEQDYLCIFCLHMCWVPLFHWMCYLFLNTHLIGMVQGGCKQLISFTLFMQNHNMTNSTQRPESVFAFL